VTAVGASARARALGVPRLGAILAGTTGLYVGAAKLGIGLHVAHGVITPVWAPSGIALAAVLLFGLRVWPAVAAGAFVANATSGVSVWIALGISIGNTLEAVSGGYLLGRLGFRPALARVRDVLAYVAVSILAATPLAATNGVTILWASDRLRSSYGAEWVLWWFGDAAGALLVGPPLLIWFVRRHTRPTGRQALELAVVLGALAGLAVEVFLLGGWRYPYVLFPLLVWAPLRFRELGAATSSFVAGAIATAGVVSGHVPLGSTETQGVEIVQALLAAVAITVLVVGATLSEREAATEALRQAQELTHIGSWEWSVASDAVRWSDELYRIYGLEPQSARIDYPAYLERVHPDDRERVDATVRRAFVDRQPFEFEHRIALPDGTERLIRSRGRVETDERGVTPRMLGTAQDVTEQRRIEQLREGILSTVSHELRTPLAAVLGFALTLNERRPDLDDQARLMIGQIVEQAQRLETLLADLLDVDRLRRERIELRRRPTRLDELVERIVELHGARPIEVHAEPVTATVDPALVGRIVDNLVANAVKHTPPDAAIAVWVARRGAEVVITVEDSGPGVPPEQRDSIFDVFTRGPDTTAPGAGIGLAIVSQYAALHAGRAWVEDAPAGGGAAFKIALPL
jgi:PAS domain S-box-containing protein